MKNTTKTLIAAAVALSAFAGTTAQASDFKWGNVYGDYYKHDREGNKSESMVVGIEGGVTTATHDMYGFAEYDATQETTFVKGSNHFKVLPGNFSVYAQAQNFSNNFGGETVAVVGVGYTAIAGDNWNFKPFIGKTFKTGSWAGEESTMIGWSSYWKPGAVMFTNWTEVEIGDAPASVNGAVGAWVDLTKNVYTGVQYTYSYKTSGERDLGNSVGVRLGYHF